MNLTALYDSHFDRVYRFIHHAVGDENVEALVERVWNQVSYDPRPSTLYRSAVAAVYHRRSATPPIPLPDDNLQRLAILLRFSADLSPAQIAVALDVPPGHAANLIKGGLFAIANRRGTIEVG